MPAVRRRRPLPGGRARRVLPPVLPLRRAGLREAAESRVRGRFRAWCAPAPPRPKPTSPSGAYALRILERSRPASGTLAERYLRRHGLGEPAFGAIRFNPVSAAGGGRPEGRTRRRLAMARSGGRAPNPARPSASPPHEGFSFARRRGAASNHGRRAASPPVPGVVGSRYRDGGTPHEHAHEPHRHGGDLHRRTHDEQDGQ